ncbi:MAG: uroporphyrinogen decarboxylase [Bacteroidota bacterium]|nr:uroporphyrinogen decarboxylase [Bacteroidota bacterium]
MSSQDLLLLKTCRGEAVERTPVWIMRQAGRYLPEYRAIRARYTMMEALNNPELAARITLMPVDLLNVDAAIIFADLLPPLIGMGLSLSYKPGRGPVIANPLRTTRQIDRLRVPPAEESMAPTLEAIRRVRSELDGRNLPLIGFAGAPFTLASYAVEGGSTRSFTHTKSLMYAQPAAWDRLMIRMVSIVTDLLQAQARAGAQCLQLFDSWAGALSRQDYVRFAQPYTKMIIARLGDEVPVIHFSTGTGSWLSEIAAAGGHVIGVDWRLPLDEAHQMVQRPVMGNLDPCALLGPWRELRWQADEVLRSMRGRTGYIFNLGHGILPNTPVDNVRRLVDYVQESTG